MLFQIHSLRLLTCKVFLRSYQCFTLKWQHEDAFIENIFDKGFPSKFQEKFKKFWEKSEEFWIIDYYIERLFSFS